MPIFAPANEVFTTEWHRVSQSLIYLISI